MSGLSLLAGYSKPPLLICRALYGSLTSAAATGSFADYSVLWNRPSSTRVLTCSRKTRMWSNSISQENSIPGTADVAVVLGVLEYLPDTVETLKRIRQCAPWLIVSHAASDVRKMKTSRAKKMNWKTYVSTTEFEQRLNAAGITSWRVA